MATINQSTGPASADLRKCRSLSLAAILALSSLTVIAQASDGVIGFNDGGWNSDDTRTALGTNITNSTTNASATSPTATSPQEVADQIHWTNFLGSRGNLGGTYLDTIASGAQKSTLSQTSSTTAPFGSLGSSDNLIDSNFSASYRWQTQNPGDPIDDSGASLKFGVQSTAWGTGSNESQESFSATRSGEASWDFVIVYDPTVNGQSATTQGEFIEANIDSDTGVFKVFLQGGNSYFSNRYDTSVIGNSNFRTLEDWNSLALDYVGNPATDPEAPGNPTTWGELLFGSGAEVSNVQFGLGSGNQGAASNLDWAEISFLSGGERIDFVDAARYTGNGSSATDYDDSGNWGAVDALDPAQPLVDTAPSGTQNFIVDAAGTTDLTVSSDTTSRSLGILNGTTNLTLASGQTLTLSSAENGTLFVESGATANVTGAGTLDASVLESAGTLNVSTVTNLNGGDSVTPVRNGRYAIVVHADGEITLQSGAAVSVVNAGNNPGVRIGEGEGTGTMNVESGSTFTVGSTTDRGFLHIGDWFSDGELNQTGGDIQTYGAVNLGHQGGDGAYNMSAGTLTVGGGTAIPGGNTNILTVSRTTDSVNRPTTGTWNISGSANVDFVEDPSGPSTFFYVGGNDATNTAGSVGVVNQTGGTVTVGEGVQFGFGYGDGTYNLTGGTLELANGGISDFSGGSSVLNLDGGTLSVTTNDLSTGVVPVLVASKNSTINTDGVNAAFSSGLTGAGSFTKVGAGDMEVGGTTTLSAGISTVEEGNFIVGSADAGPGTLNLNTGAELNVDSQASGFSRIIVGNDGTGTMNIGGGTVDLTHNGSNGATFRVGGNGGTGTVNMTDGAVTVQEGITSTQYGVIDIGSSVGSIGEFNQSGDSTITQTGVGNLHVGTFGGQGTFSMSDDAEFTMDEGTTYFGEGATGSATVNFSGDARFAQTNVQNYIAQDGAEAEFNQDGAGTNVTWSGGASARPFWMGVGAAGGTGTYNLSAGSLTYNNINLRLGSDAGTFGTINQSAGTLEAPGTSVSIGYEGTGTFDISGGQATFDQGLTLASRPGSTGTVDQSGGTVTIGSGSKVQFGAGTGTYNLDGGTLEVGGTDGIDDGTGTTAFNLGGGALRVVDFDLTTSMVPTLGATTTSTVDTNSFNAVFENGLAGTGAFTKVGAGDMEIGGTTTLSGTSTVEEGNFVVGSADAGTGTLNLNTGAALNVDSGGVGGGFDRIIVGNGGTGVMNIDGGSIDLAYYNGDGKTFRVGAAGGDGTVNMTDGSVTVTEGTAGSYGVIVVGQDAGSTGVFDQSGGTISQNGTANLQVGVLEGTGIYSMTNDASFTQSGSGSTNFFGEGASGSATINISDSATFEQTVGGDSYIAQNGATTVFNQNGVDTNVTWRGAVWVGRGPGGGSGTYNLSAGNLTFADVGMQLGKHVDAFGTINQTGGVLETPGTSFAIGYEGTGTFDISDGQATFNQGVTLASQAGSTGTVDQSGGTVTIGSGSKVQFGAGTGTYNLDGGTLEVGGTDGIDDGSGTSTFSLGGGTLRVVDADLSVGSGIEPELKSSTTSTIDTNGFDASFDGGFTGAGNLVKDGAGALTVDGTSTNTGFVDVNDGSLLVEGTLTGSALTVDSGATLGGSGTVTAATTVAGTLAPGSSPGIQTFTSGLTLGSTSLTQIEIAANSSMNRGTDFDAINVTGGTLEIASGAELALIFDGAGSTVDFLDSFWDFDQSWLLFDNATTPTLAGPIFASISVTPDINSATLPGGAARFGVEQQGDDVVLTYTIPEPESFAALFGLLSVAIVTLRRRESRV